MFKSVYAKEKQRPRKIQVNLYKKELLNHKLEVEFKVEAAKATDHLIESRVRPAYFVTGPDLADYIFENGNLIAKLLAIVDYKYRTGKFNKKFDVEKFKKEN